MAVSMALRLSCSSPSAPLIFRAFRSRRLSFPLDSTLLRSTVRFCSNYSSVAVEEKSGAPTHQWPEWETFVSMLKAKGHLASAAVEEGDAQEEGDVDYNRLKNACLMFARDRFDLFRYLSTDDIRGIVEYGCPSMQRKPTNSGKRLRAFLMLNESDVCGICTLRGSCDRANLTLNTEQGPRTVDVLRIVLHYAVEPNLLSRFDSSQRGRIEASIRSLLSKLTELSDTPVDPSLLDAVNEAGMSKEKPEKSKSKLKSKSRTGSNSHFMNVEMKRGDWLCTKCNFLNFSRNLSCMECGADGPKKVDISDFEMKKGDWSCPQCQFVNFARNRECRRCQELRPARELNPGEWECPSCDFLNYRRNKICLKCKHEGPREAAEVQGSGGHQWRRPVARR